MCDKGLSIDQELAKKLLVEGATLIILNLPPESEFGIDLKSWQTGNKFKGVKMIPPGLHMFYYNISNKHGDICPRVSFIHNFKKAEILVKKWNSNLEELVSDEPSEEELTRLKSNLFNLDQFLGPYPYDVLEKWNCLIGNITDKLVERVTPECGIIRSALDLVSGESKYGSTCDAHSLQTDVGNPSTPNPYSSGDNEARRTPEENSQQKVESTASSTEEPSQASCNCPVKRRRRKRLLEESLLPHLSPTPGTQLRFTQVPEDLFPKDSTPADITRHSIDPTFTLETLLSSMDSEKEYVGEVELSFVCFLAGESLDALEAWKSLVTLACRCENAVSKRPIFYSALLSILNVQLEHIPEDFLVDIVESENAIYSSLRDFFRSALTCDSVDSRLKKSALAFSQRLSLRFGWDFSNLDEDDEDEAPVIVDLEEHL